jgi:hypothetical protein
MNPITRDQFAAMIAGEFGPGQERDRAQNPALAQALDREAAMQQEAANRLGPSDMLGLLGAGEVSVDPAPRLYQDFGEGVDPGWGMMGEGRYRAAPQAKGGYANNWQAQEAPARRRIMPAPMNPGPMSGNSDAHEYGHYSQYTPEAVQALLPQFPGRGWY